MAEHPARYLLLAAVFVMAVFGVMLAFTAVVDPFAVSKVSVEWPFNSVKVARGDQDRFYRAYDPIMRPPQILLLGTSRVNKGMDPAVVEELTGKRTYAAGLNGASYYELASLLRSWLERGVPIEQVVIDLYYWRIISRPDNTIPPHRFGAVGDFFASYLSTDALISAIKTVAANSLGLVPRHFRKDGFESPRPARARRPQEGGFGPWWDQAMKLVRPVQPDDLVPIREIRDLCRDHGIRCYFVLSPIHPYRLAVFQRDGLLDILMDMKKVLAAIAPIYDFSRYDPEVFHDFCHPTTAWRDPGHFAPETGDRIIRALFESAQLNSSDFGRPVTEDTIEKDNQVWANQIATWRDRNEAFGRIGNNGTEEYSCPAETGRGR